ncbi:MAG: anhydro-N-acetylmuramic acid kinase [candidate division Zixibacteria bacterium]
MPDLLKGLTAKKNLTILGINSGTSADGIDLAAIKFAAAKNPEAEYIAGKMVSYPGKIKRELENIIDDRRAELERLSRLDIAYGQYLGRAARKFIDETGLKIDAIASHGQTISHYPYASKSLGIKTKATIQIGDGNAIAFSSGLPTISDFRRADIACGGEGAPLTPFVNQILFGHARRGRIIVNIGGIANFSYHPSGQNYNQITGGDCGPGNVLSDTACKLMFGKLYDKNGEVASSGKIENEIVSAIIKANKRKSVSTGREQFDYRLLARLVHISRKINANKNSIVTSVCEGVARLIHKSIRKYLDEKYCEAVYLCGGGRKNIYLIKRLIEYCRPIPIWPIEKLGYDGDLLEAVGFAVLGGCYLNSIASTLPKVTGALAGGIAGKLSLPEGGKVGKMVK